MKNREDKRNVRKRSRRRGMSETYEKRGKGRKGSERNKRGEKVKRTREERRGERKKGGEKESQHGKHGVIMDEWEDEERGARVMNKK